MLIMDNITVRVAGRVLIEAASAQVPDGSRIGLVGRNGTGKTTLFSVISGEFSAETGDVRLPNRTRIGRIAQEAPSGPQTLLETVLAADKERSSLLAEAESAQDPARIADIQTRLVDIEAHSAPARAASILAGLGFSAEAQERPCSEFSGGWRMRVALASLLFTTPDLLLLDEPTNYLDLEGTLWLEAFLARYPRTLIVISHDRDLLDNVAQSILHLHDRKLTLYKGGYSQFERQRRERQMIEAKAARKQDVERKHLQSFVDRFRAKASKARQAQSRLKRLQKLEPVAGMSSDDVRPIVIPAPEKTLSPPIVVLDEVEVGYSDERPVLRQLTLNVDNDDRIALLGSNGNGKSTFAKLLAGRLAPQSGRVVRAEKLKIAYFAQHQLDELRPQESPFQHLRQLMPEASEAQVRSRLAQIGFPADMGNSRVATLSGGEKARLLLGLATFGGAHLVILDEPTNHLDIDSRSALIEAINSYSGAVMLISHDRHLLDACADRLWIVQNGRVTAFDGDLDQYRRLVLSGEAEAPSAAAKGLVERTSKADARRNSAERRAGAAPLRDRVAQAEKLVARLNRELARLDQELARPGLFERNPAEGASLAKRRAGIARDLAVAEEEWLQASVAADTVRTA